MDTADRKWLTDAACLASLTGNPLVLQYCLREYRNPVPEGVEAHLGPSTLKYSNYEKVSCWGDASWSEPDLSAATPPGDEGISGLPTFVSNGINGLPSVQF